jgi:hypothetical protein
MEWEVGADDRHHVVRDPEFVFSRSTVEAFHSSATISEVFGLLPRALEDYSK